MGYSLKKVTCRVVDRFYLGDVLTSRILMALVRKKGFRDVKDVVKEIVRDVKGKDGDDLYMKILRRLRNLADCGVLQWRLQHVKNRNISKYVLVLDSTAFIAKDMKALIRITPYGVEIHDCRYCDKKDCEYRPIYFDVLKIEEN